MDSGLLSKEEVLIVKARILENVNNQTNTKDDITEGEGVSNVTDIPFPHGMKGKLRLSRKQELNQFIITLYRTTICWIMGKD